MPLKQTPEWAYPETKGLTRRVSMMRAYLTAPHAVLQSAKELFAFVEMMESDLNRIVDLESNPRPSARQQDEIFLLKRKVITCFQHFENGYHLYIKGTSGDSPLDDQYDMSYVGSIRTILSVLNSMTRQTFKASGYPERWRGFVTFSNTVNFRTAEASIIVLPFFAKHSVEMIQEWLFIAHEIGHVYFWKYPSTYTNAPRSVMDELLADFFSLEQAYALDIARFSEDFNSIRFRYQDPRHGRFYAFSYDARLMSALLYVCCRLEREFLRELIAYMRSRPARNPATDGIIGPFVKQNIDWIVEIILKYGESVRSYDGFYEADSSSMKGFIREGFLTGWTHAVKRWYGHFRQNRKMPQEMELGILAFIVALASGSEKMFAPVLRHDHVEVTQRDRDAFNSISNGVVTEIAAESPLLFVKRFSDYCRGKNINLDKEEAAHIRAALILSFCGNGL